MRERNSAETVREALEYAQTSLPPETSALYVLRLVKRIITRRIGHRRVKPGTAQKIRRAWEDLHNALKHSENDHDNHLIETKGFVHDEL